MVVDRALPDPGKRTHAFSSLDARSAHDIRVVQQCRLFFNVAAKGSAPLHVPATHKVIQFPWILDESVRSFPRRAATQFHRPGFPSCLRIYR